MAISQLVVRVFDLVEAEGAALRTAVRGEATRAHAAASSMAVGVAILLIAVPLTVGGAFLLAAGLMLWLETQVGLPLAAGLTGLVVLATGVGCLLCFRSVVGSRTP